MTTLQNRTLRSTCALAALLAASAQAAESGGTVSGSITTTLGLISVDGSEAAFRKSQGQTGKTYGGIEDLTLNATDGDKLSADLKARFIADENDYGAALKVTREGLGSFEFSFRENRAWYNGLGGVAVRPNGTIAAFPLADDMLALDRLSMRAALTIQTSVDAPKFTLAYEYQAREGDKNSTIMGETANVGYGTSARGIVPAINRIDEKRHAVTLDGEHTMGMVHFGGGLRYERIENDNQRIIRRTPGVATTDRYVNDSLKNENDLFAGYGFAEIRPNETWYFSTAASTMKLDGDLSGSRIYGGTENPAFNLTFPNRVGRDGGILDLLGTSSVREYVWHASAAYTPTKHWTIVPAVKAEKYDQDADSAWVLTETGTTSARTVVLEPMEADSSKDFTELAGSIEVRYTGLKNTLLYVRGEVTDASGELEEEQINEHTHAIVIDRLTDYSRRQEQAAAGFNWAPSTVFRLAGKVYVRANYNTYDSLRDNTPGVGGNRYPDFVRKHNFVTEGAFARMTYKLAPNMTSVTRIDYQDSTAESAGTGRPLIDSGEWKLRTYSQTFSWMPAPRWYLQLGGSFTDNELTTPADRLTGAVLDDVQLSRQDWWTVDGSLTFVASDKDDLSFSFSHLKSDNFAPNYQISVPYGVTLKESTLKATWIHRFSDRFIGTLQYGYVISDDVTSAGLNDFIGHAISTKLQMNF